MTIEDVKNVAPYPYGQLIEEDGGKKYSFYMIVSHIRDVRGAYGELQWDAINMLNK